MGGDGHSMEGIGAPPSVSLTLVSQSLHRVSVSPHPLALGSQFPPFLTAHPISQLPLPPQLPTSTSLSLQKISEPGDQCHLLISSSAPPPNTPFNSLLPPPLIILSRPELCSQRKRRVETVSCIHPQQVLRSCKQVQGLCTGQERQERDQAAPKLENRVHHRAPKLEGRVLQS